MCFILLIDALRAIYWAAFCCQSSILMSKSIDVAGPGRNWRNVAPLWRLAKSQRSKTHLPIKNLPFVLSVERLQSQLVEKLVFCPVGTSCCVCSFLLMIFLVELAGVGTSRSHWWNSRARRQPSAASTDSRPNEYRCHAGVTLTSLVIGSQGFLSTDACLPAPMWSPVACPSGEEKRANKNWEIIILGNYTYYISIPLKNTQNPNITIKTDSNGKS